MDSFISRQTSQDIVVEVVSTYEPLYSRPCQGEYIFSYHIQIRNQGKHSVQLLFRSWEITDAFGHKRMIEGEGVIGQQPIIKPGMTYSYDSWVSHSTPIGSMSGHYVMRLTDKHIDDGHSFFMVYIPKFVQCETALLN